MKDKQNQTNGLWDRPLPQAVETAKKKSQEHLEQEHSGVRFDADKVEKQQWKGDGEHRKSRDGYACSEIKHEPLHSPEMRQKPNKNEDENSDDKRPTNLLNHSLRLYKTKMGIQVVSEKKLPLRARALEPYNYPSEIQRGESRLYTQ
jgi:hypothetical protein